MQLFYYSSIFFALLAAGLPADPTVVEGDTKVLPGHTTYGGAVYTDIQSDNATPPTITVVGLNQIVDNGECVDFDGKKSFVDVNPGSRCLLYT